MPAYSFEALQPDGKPRKGVLEADTARAARAQLRAQGLAPLQVEAISAGDAQKAQGTAQRQRAFNSTQLAVWTRQLAGLIAAGLPLERALAALADEAEDERQRHCCSVDRKSVVRERV